METASLQRSSSLGVSQPPRVAEAGVAAPRITTLQWAIGIFCTFTGALMIVAPHQFSGPIWSTLQGQLPGVGFLFLLAGAALVGCGVLGASRRWVVACHFGAVAALLPLIYNLAVVGLWQGAVFQITFALGTLLAPFVARLERPGRPTTGDFFALVFGAANAAYGLLMLVLPDLFRLPIYDPIRPDLPLYGAAFLVTNAALALAQFRPTWPAWLSRAAHLAILVPCTAYGLAVPLPTLTWTGIIIYCGLSPLVASLPWSGPALRRVDPRSFTIRLAFALVLAAALPLIAITGMVITGQERLARAEAEAGLEASAASMASDVSHYITSYRGSVVALASYPRLLELPPADQQVVLRGFAEAFPDALVFSTYDAAGAGIARSDGHPLASGSGLQFFEDARRMNAPSLEVRISRTYGVPSLVLGAPIRASDGSLGGVAATALTSEWVMESLSQSNHLPGSRVYVIDAAGCAIAHPDSSLASAFADLSATPQVARLLASSAEHGVVSSSGPNGDVLAAYARVPGLGWTVVVDRPASSALAAVRNGRNADFGMLLGAVAMAVVAGTLLARQLAGPLAGLSHAARQLARGDTTATLPRDGTSEVQELVTTFGETRDRLVARDAEKERLLDEIQRRASELDAIVSSMIAGVAMYDAAGQMLLLNPAGERMLRYSRADQAPSLADRVAAIRMQTSDGALIAPRDTPTGRALRGELVHDATLLIRRPDGTRFWMSASAAPIRAADGVIVGAVSTFTDVTERIELQAEREQLLTAERSARAQAEAAVRTRDEFLSVAAHELKTPVTSLRGYAQLLLRQMQKTGELDPARVALVVTSIDHQSRRLTRLVNQLLDISRIEAGKLTLDPQMTDIPAMVEEVIASLRRVHPGRDFTFGTDGPVLALADSLRLEQVITNLLDNAVKFSPESSPIEIAVGTEVSHAIEGGRTVAIAVRDHGPGIPAEKRAHIFDRYYQAHDDWHGGLGLGLFISRQIVELHGGTIAVECPDDGGSRFIVRLPLGTNQNQTGDA